jgi:dienelactone hydrolase
MTPPRTREEWAVRRNELRRQILVATGLWPLPAKTPLEPVVHGKIERDGYTIEKVYFASYPGHYVCGNLYRPKGDGKHPGVLSPHGHWRNGRFYTATETEVAAQVKQGAEQTLASARFPLQARCAQLARMGCVVFHYDMVGSADSQQIEHTVGFTDAEAELRLQSFMGLQTYNSIRALDFLSGLPDVDHKRIGVTGASGGGTQTFILCAIDDRPAVAFPAVMVSTAMQGGCVCENCSYLRQGTGNIEFAGMFAPKPLGMTGANDWTREIETKGLPELKALYALHDAENHVMARCFPQFGHNYNQVSREVMYNWFNVHLYLNQAAPVVEKPFIPVAPEELSVFDGAHSLPSDAVDAAGLRKVMTTQAADQLRALEPKDQKSLEAFRETLSVALRVMIHDRLPVPDEVEARVTGAAGLGPVRLERLVLGRKGQQEEIPAILATPANQTGSLVIWIHPSGKSSLYENGEPTASARKLLDKGIAILAPDVFLTGEFGTAPKAVPNRKYAGFTFGYNRPLLANRVHDILSIVAFARADAKTTTLDLVGFDSAGPWVILARALCGNAVRRTLADANHFDFAKVTRTEDDMMLPGALKYGGLTTAVALCAPGDLYVMQTEGIGSVAKAAYAAASAADHLTLASTSADSLKGIDWLLRRP